MTDTPLRLSAVKKTYSLSKSLFGISTSIQAVNDVSMTLRAGETLGLVGESGCGKSTLARMICMLEPPSSGSIEIEGHDVSLLKGKRQKALRRSIQMVFQDPYSSMNPRLTIAQIVREPLDNYRVGRVEDRRQEVLDLLSSVGLSPSVADGYPHELSGGQRQRVAIARALALDPKIIVADEPVSALDVSVQAQVLNLLADIRKRAGLTMVFVSHDLSVVRHVCDRIAVMYLGQIMELSDTNGLFAEPLHPYSQALIAAVPSTHPRLRKQRTMLKGDIPSPSRPPAGCPFNTRCPNAIARCVEERPALRRFGDRYAACHLVEDLKGWQPASTEATS